MSRNFYDIDPAGEVLCMYTDGGERGSLRSVSAAILHSSEPPTFFSPAITSP